MRWSIWDLLESTKRAESAARNAVRDARNTGGSFALGNAKSGFSARRDAALWHPSRALRLSYSPNYVPTNDRDKTWNTVTHDTPKFWPQKHNAYAPLSTFILFVSFFFFVLIYCFLLAMINCNYRVSKRCIYHRLHLDFICFNSVNSKNHFLFNPFSRNVERGYFLMNQKTEHKMNITYNR